MEQIIFTTGLPNDFIDVHLPVAKPVYSVIYIYGYRQYSKGVRQICCGELAEIFDVSAERVEAVWEYWQKVGLVQILSASDGVLELAFLNAPAQNNAAKSKAAAHEPDPVPENQRIVSADFPEYSLEDIEAHLNDPEVRRLFYAAHTLLGKPLSDIERRMFLAFYDDLGLSVDVITVLLEYCVEKNKTHNNYLRTVAFDWASRGIATVDDAEEYIKLFSNEYREILRYYGVSGRDPIDKETEYMHKWLKTDGFTMEVIKKACERTIMNKARPSFAYTDGILKKWQQDNVHTIEQIESLEKSYYDGVKATRKSGQKAEKGREKPQTRFQNYKGRKWDYDKLALMEQEYLNRKVAE